MKLLIVLFLDVCAWLCWMAEPEPIWEKTRRQEINRLADASKKKKPKRRAQKWARL